MRQNYSVAIYLVDRAYGGPEEGDWWYNKGRIIKLMKVCTTEDQAYQYSNRLQRLLDKTLNKGRRDIGSVLSEGQYFSEVHEGCPPKYYPEVTPRYE